jgi:TrmH family RNA methyltransferase
MKARARRELSSARHPLLKQMRTALRQGELTPDGYCVIEGIHLVEEALRSPVEVAALVGAHSAETVLERFEAAADASARSYLVPDRVFRSLAETETPQGIAALVRLPVPRLEECVGRRGALVMVLAGLQDPGNLGTILRALEAFGGAACLLTPNTVSPFNAKAVRASSGALFRVPVFRRLQAERTLTLCRAHGLRTVGLAPRARQPLSQLDLKGPLAFFVGSEGSGLPPELEAKMDATACIPLTAPVESLNAAMAASLALYEAARQRGWVA